MRRNNGKGLVAREAANAPNKKHLEQIIRTVCKSFEIEPALSITRSLDRKSSEAKGLIYTIANDYMGIRNTKLATIFKTCESTVITSRYRFRRRIQITSPFTVKIEKILIKLNQEIEIII